MSDRKNIGQFSAKSEIFVYGVLDAQGVTFKSADPGAKWGKLVVANASSVLKNCTFQDAEYGLVVSASGITVGGDNITDGNTFSNCTYGVYINAQGNTVKNNTFNNCTYGVHVSNAGNATISNNLLLSHTALGIWVTGGSSTNTQIDNNTLSSTFPGAAGIYFQSGSSGTVKNTIATQYNQGGLRADAGTSVSVAHYMPYLNSPTFELANVQTANRKAIFSNPWFVNPAGVGGDYHLQSTSPALDLGDSTQIDPNGSRRDLGRYGNTSEAGTASGALKAEDYFINGVATGWQEAANTPGTWSGDASQGTYTVTNVNGASRRWKAINATSYTIETRMKFGGQEGKVIYSQADQHGDWRLDLITTMNRVRLITPVTTSDVPYPGGSISPNTWYHVRVEVYVNGETKTATTYVNGYLCNNSINIGSQTVTDGKVGIGSYGGPHSAEFDYFVVMNGSGTPPDLATGLVSYWSFDYNTLDTKGANHGFASGVTHRSDDYKLGGGSYYFDGNDYIATGLIGFPTGGNPRTTAAWIKTSASGLHEIFSYGSGSTGQAWTMGQWDASVFFSAWASPQYTVSSSGLNDNTWRHVAVTYSGGTAKIYVNGNPIDTRSAGISTGTANGAVIGARIYPEEYFAGFIDEVGVWDRALSDTEISALYNGGAGYNPAGPSPPSSPLASGLVSYWPFDGNANDIQGPTYENGSVNGATAQSTGGKLNGCYWFGGSANISLNYTLPTTDFSVSFWAYQTGGVRPFGAGDSYVGSHGIDIWPRLSGSSALFIVRRNGAGYDFWGGNSNLNQWYHWVVTVSQTEGVKGYINGVLTGSNSGGTSISTGNIVTRVGSSGDNGAYFQGYIDEVGYWNRPLSGTEVAQLYNSGAGINPLAKPVLDQVAGGLALLPAGTRLVGNYPNPFNPETMVRYEISRPERVHLGIYNLLGQQVRVLVERVVLPGVYEAAWDGRDAQGRAVASGVYIYRLVTPSYTESRKMTILR